MEREFEKSRPARPLDENRSQMKSSKISSLDFPPKVILVVEVLAKLLAWFPFPWYYPMTSLP
jgi:hypothetical protein